MRTFRWYALAWFCIFALRGMLPAAAAEPLALHERAAVRAVIEDQLAAFANDDAERAFSHASPTIQETFVTARNFMDMVRISYPVVYRPASLRFQVPFSQEGAVWQVVAMRDAAGTDWTAVYTLLRQGDGAWRINGCVLQRGLGASI